MSEVFTNEPQNSFNPYQAPSAAGTNEFADRPTLPVSPIWALLISLSPLPLSLGAAAAFARDEQVFICFSLAFAVLSFDAAAFVSRTVWIGSGKRSLRMAAAVFVTVTIALSPAALVAIAGRELRDFAPVRFAVQHVLITCLCVGLAAIVFAWGSRDRLRQGARRLPPKYDVAAVAFAAVVTAVATAVAISERRLYSAERFEEYATGFDPSNYRPLITIVAAFLMTMVWRVLIRGMTPWKSWKILGLGTIASLWTLLNIALALAAGLTGGGGLGAAFAFSLVVVPAGRELFLLFAGYRAFNVYAERRGTRALATPIDDSNS